MGSNELRIDEQKAEFAKKYIPKGVSFGTLGEGENPFAKEYKLGHNEYPIHIAMFREAGLRLPLGPLMVDFLKTYKFVIGQLSLNVFRIIRGVERLNEVHGRKLCLNELRYCYILTKGEYGYSLKARKDAPRLVLVLPDSSRGADSDTIVLIGDIVPNPFYKPIPQRASGQGEFDKFDRPPEFAVEIPQINAVASHDGGVVHTSVSFHPRATNQLLEYPDTRTSFLKRDRPFVWLGPGWRFWQKEVLFRKYKVVNLSHNREREYELKKGNQRAIPGISSQPTASVRRREPNLRL